MDKAKMLRYAVSASIHLQFPLLISIAPCALEREAGKPLCTAPQTPSDPMRKPGLFAPPPRSLPRAHPAPRAGHRAPSRPRPRPGPAPGPRMHFGMAADGPVAHVHGGFDGVEHLADHHCLDLRAMRWARLPAAGPAAAEPCSQARAPARPSLHTNKTAVPPPSPSAHVPLLAP